MRKILLRIIIPLLFFAGAFLVPFYAIESDIANFLTVASLLFAILLGFFIATATANYLNFQSYLSEEGASLTMLYNLGKLVQPSAEKKIAEAIDTYLIATLDFGLSEYVEKTSQELKALIEVIDNLEPKDKQYRRIAALSYLHETKSNFLKARHAITFTAPRVTTNTHWTLIVLLTGTLMFFLFALREGDMLSAVMVGILSAALYLILLVLYEVDGNLLLEEQLAYGDVQGVFHSIGKLSYYPSLVIERGIITKPKENHRIGVYKDYPRSTKKTIKLVPAVKQSP